MTILARYPIDSFSTILERRWIFEPLPWIENVFGGRTPLVEATAIGIQRSWCTAAVADNRVLAIGGLAPKRHWRGACIEAEAWAVPCIGIEQYPYFITKTARGILAIQDTQRIQRVEAFILGEFTAHRRAAVAFLEKGLGFHFESYRDHFLPGQQAACFVRIRQDFAKPSRVAELQTRH